MGIAYNSKLVRNGLVLCLDAGNAKSYPSTGTAWSDISGNDKNGTLTNGPTYDSANGGSILMDGVNDAVVLSNSYTGTTIPTGSSSRTLITCFKTQATFSGANYEHIVHYGTTATDQAFGITIYNISGSYYIANHTWAGNSYMSNTTLSANTVYYVALTYNDSAAPRNTFFLNGSFGTTGYAQGKTADYSLNTGTGNQLLVGSRLASAEYFKGNVFFVQMYNRVLTNAEIEQNYAASRGRYGL